MLKLFNSSSITSKLKAWFHNCFFFGSLSNLRGFVVCMLWMNYNIHIDKNTKKNKL